MVAVLVIALVMSERTAGPVTQGRVLLNRYDKQSNVDRAINLLVPFVESKRVVLVPEMNYSGQFAQLLRARYLRELVSVTEYSGGVFTVARLVQEIEGVRQHAR